MHMTTFVQAGVASTRAWRDCLGGSGTVLELRRAASHLYRDLL
jgi:hypothetical protein